MPILIVSSSLGLSVIPMGAIKIAIRRRDRLRLEIDELECRCYQLSLQDDADILN